MKILIVEDHHLLGKSLKQGLEDVGWVVDWVTDGEEGLYFLQNSEYHIALVDWMLPKMSGTELLAQMRGLGLDVPTIILTAKSSLPDRIMGFDLGADDYLTKPFELAELVARIRALHRRSSGPSIKNLQADGILAINSKDRVVKVNGAILELTAKEFDLLETLAGHPNQVIGRDELSNLLYEFNSGPLSNSLDVLMARLRKKLHNPQFKIETVRGKGFVFRVEPHVAGP